MKFVLASHNQGKLAEMQRILDQLGVEVVLQSELGLALEPEETGTTFTENARIKAEAVMQASGLPAIADDSGLCVDALNGAPGVYSARYGGPGLDDPGRVRLLLGRRCGPLSAAAGESPGSRDPCRPLPYVGGVLLPQRGRAGGRGRLPRHYRLCPAGGERLRL